MKRLFLLAAAWLLLAPAGSGFAQGIQTGTIRGLASDPQNLAVPGVAVTATSPALQGPRTAVTDSQGNYALRALPPGDYQIKFELSGFAIITRNVTLPLGLVIEQSVSMHPANVSEQVDVVAEAPAPIATPIVGANFKHEEIDALATPRSIEGIAQLSPAVTENTPNTNQIAINGAFAFDSAFLVNGVDINDNVFAQPQNLFIPDAIQETQVLTSGVPAEYGRFTGGVINAITKSGGNIFSGTGRLNLSNPSWATETPFEVTKGVTHPDLLGKVYEGTFGGPIVSDRLWFFASGRYGAVDSSKTLPQTGVQVVQNDNNKRGEIKLTGDVGRNQTIQGGFLNDPETISNDSGAFSLIMDPHSLSTVSMPNWYYFTNYRGVVNHKLLVEAQFSERNWKALGGGTGTTILDSPFLSQSTFNLYNAPYFDGTDPEQRNNRQLTGSVTRSWDLAGLHDTKGGYEWFRSQRTGGGGQSPTSYVFFTDFLTNAAGPVLDATGRPIPVFVPGTSVLQYYPAIQGATLNNDSNSLYLQDHWTINNRWSADLGARYEHVRAASTGSIVSIDNNRIVPRLATAYDVKGDGNHIVHVTYGQYSGRYNEAQIGKNSPVGNAPEIDSVYQGPAGQGYSFAPGVNVANYPINAANSSVADATQNVFLAPGTKSPLTHEFTVSYGTSLLKGRGYAEATYVARVTHDLIEDFETVPGGFTNATVNGIDAGTFTNIVFQNTDLAHRQYQAMVFQSRYRVNSHWNVNGHYTVQLKNDGNYEGEGTNQPGMTSFIGNYPEAFNAARNYPDGRLQDFQRSRLRIWSVYDWNMSRYGTLSVSGLWRVDSGRVYSLAARNQALTGTQKAILAAAGYPDLPASTGNMVFFTGSRGDQTFPGYGLFDTSINYDVPVFRALRPWVKLEVYNLFNDEKLIAWNTTIAQNTATVDNLGLGTTYIPSAAFGTASGNTVTNLNSSSAINAYPLAFAGATPGGRTFLMSVGFRF
jgi:hypothetical protein